MANKRMAKKAAKKAEMKAAEAKKVVTKKAEPKTIEIQPLEKKEEVLNEKIRENDALKTKNEEIILQQSEMLQKISGMSVEDARAMLMERVESEARHEMAMKLMEVEQECKDKAEESAKNIIALAIQRCAADSVSEATVSVVDLPSDEMKGRIIGREGRNIRSIEQITGVELIIDDTPEAITISSFDPVRREVARLTLERLIQDGRIHPTRIEEMFEKSKREVEATIKSEGEKAVVDAKDYKPDANMIEYTLEGGSSFIVRPSGTEPKIKVYLLVHSETAEEAAEVLSAIADQNYNKNGSVYIFDIYVTKDGARVQPNGKVKVSIPVPNVQVDNYLVFHIKSDNSVESLVPTVADGKISFETSSPSLLNFSAICVDFPPGAAQRSSTLTGLPSGSSTSFKKFLNTCPTNIEDES